jgi:ammonium transporter, Amt family
MLGIDDVEIGEFAYDYVELTREVKSPDDDDLSGEHSLNFHDDGREKGHRHQGSVDSAGHLD